MSKHPGVWRIADFARLWAAHTVSMLGSHVSFLALPLIAAGSLGASPWEMGMLQAANALPALVLGLFAGVWVDRHRRQPILIAANVVQAALLVVIAATTWAGVLRVEYLWGLAFALGAARLLFDVADQSLLPSLVGREHLHDGNAQLELSRSGVAIIGPGVAGGLVQLVTAPLAIVFDAATFVVSALLIRTIRAREDMTEAPTRQPVRHAIRDGLRFVFGQRSLRALTGALATVALCTSVLDAVLLLYMTRVLRLEPGLLGVVFAVGSVGFLAGTWVQRRVHRRFGLAPTLVAGVVLTGSGDLILTSVGGASPLVLIVAALMGGQFCYGIGRTLFSISQITLRQTLTPDHLQGRMNASIRFLVAGFVVGGAVLGGILGEVLGLRATLVLAALGEIAAVLWLLPGRPLREQRL